MKESDEEKGENDISINKIDKEKGENDISINKIDKEKGENDISINKIDVENKILDKIRSIKTYDKNRDDDSSDDGRDDIADQIYLPEISTVKRKEDKFYQHFLPIENGIYNGTINEKFLREGLGTFSINNNEEFYSGEWKNDQYNGYGFNSKNNASTIYHGEFLNGILKEGYGKITLENGYEYEGKIKDGKFHGLGSLSIKILGLTEINQSNIEKSSLKVVADWKEGKTEKKFIYLNEIEEYYQYQYEVFSNSLESLILLNRDNYKKQREYLKNLIDLYEKRFSNLNLLKEIATHSTLPRELKFSADLLLRLDNSHTNLDKYIKIELKKTYQDCLIDVCQKGLKFYARRLAWFDDENIVDCISSKIIFDETLNNFLNKSQLIDLKKVLYLNPLVIELIRKLIRFANERLNQISLKYRTQFIHQHTTFIKNLWINYFQNLEFYFIHENSHADNNNEKYHFYSDCYLTILELSFISQLEIQIKLERKIKNSEKDCLIEVKLNEQIVFIRTSIDSNNGIYLIVFDEVNRHKKFEKFFHINNSFNETNELKNFIENEINSNEIFLVIVPFEATGWLTKDIKNFFKTLGSTKIDQINKDMAWIFITRKNINEKYEEEASKNDNQLMIKRNFRLNANENILLDQNTNIEQIETIIYNTMTFTLDYFKPWENFQIKQWSDYFNQSINENISTKEIGDQLLIKILQDSKNYVLSCFKNNKKNDSFSDHLESMITYYQKSLIEDTNLNYQNKIKEIKKIFLYFLQISENENVEIEDIKNLQLKTIKVFIEGKQTITEIIDYFLSFNREFSKLSKKFDNYFSHRKHEKFNRNCQEIICLLTEIFQIIFNNNEKNSSEILNKYQTKNLEDTLKKSILNKNFNDIKFLLFDFDIDINQLDLNSKKNLLDLVIEEEDEDLILYLLEKGFRFNLKTNKKSKIDLNSLLNKIKTKPKENSNIFNSKLFAMQKMINFLTNLGSLDLSWFVEEIQIKNFIENIFKKVGEKDIYQVLDIEKGKIQVNDSCPHYLLETLIELLKIIKDFNINNKIKHIEMIKLRAELIMAIEKSFNYFKDQIKYNSLSSFKDDCVKPFKDIIENNQTYSNFYEKLEKLDLFFLYTRKLKEITVDQALELFRKENENLFDFKKIENIFIKYDKLFKEYFSNILNKKKSIKDIIKKTKEIANKSNFDRDNISSIIAGLSIVLSLTVSHFIEKNSHGEYILKNKFNKDYLLQPHCIQILGVFILLDINGNSNSIPPNHIAQILTGQGKSWALALLAGYFSLIGYNVTVACYSNYLSQRDEKDFKKNFDAFQFTNEIKYKTFETMCNDKLSINNKSLRDLLSDIISGNELYPFENKKNQIKSILLIDEVDIFFSNNFGQMYRACVLIKNKYLPQIQKNIWEEIILGNTDKNKLIDLIQRKIANFIEDKMLSILDRVNLLKPHIQKMINNAVEIYEDMNNKNIFKEKYKIINDKIHVKDSHGKYISTTYYQYENTFNYLKLIYEKEGTFNNIELNEENFGYILFTCGTISYSELPNSYDGVFGVSGSLKNLSNGEKSVLEYYHINKKSYYPSFFGRSKLIFDKEKDFIIREDKKEWFNKIVLDTRDKIRQERSVLIFFENEDLLDEFYNSYSGDLGVIPFFITLNKIFDGKEKKIYNDFDVNKLIKDEYAGHTGKVTLLTKEFGRGVDFQAETIVNEKGGIHVIQTFFSIDIKEEIQIKGRTARKDEPGSYHLILCLDHLQNSSQSKVGINSIFENITKDTTYDELDKQRQEKINSFCQDKLKDIENTRKLHNLTLEFFEQAITQCNENNREEFINKIMELKF